MALPRWSPQLYVFCLIPLVHAYTVFETNCSAPVTQANYVASPNTRGTLDILWGSLFTIFACTWTLQHPNVPKQRGEDESKLQDDLEVGYSQRHLGWVALMRAKWRNAKWREAKWENMKWGLNSFYRSTLRMLLTLLAPELIIAVAFDDLRRASEGLKDMKEFIEKDKVAWSLRHSYYANMGGFVIRLRGQPSGELSAPYRPYPIEFFEDQQRWRPYHHPYHLTCKSIIALRECGHISKLPDVKEEEIIDKSKGDALVKIIALGQILWSIIQIIARAIRNLPVSPLELAVVAYAVCAVIIYNVYWYKPQRIGVAHIIQLATQETNQGTIQVISQETNREPNHETTSSKTNKESNHETSSETNEESNHETSSETILEPNQEPNLETTSEVDRLSLQQDNQRKEALPDTLSLETFQSLEPHGSRRLIGAVMKSQPAPMGAPISMDSIPRGKKLTPLIAAIFAAPFGAIHAVAWNFAFPTTVELMLWRWLSIYLTAAPLCAWLLLMLNETLDLSNAPSFDFPGPMSVDFIRREMRYWTFRRRRRLFFFGIIYLFVVLYILARLFILAEMFRTLCFLPPGSYVSTWTTNMPHLA